MKSLQQTRIRCGITNISYSKISAVVNGSVGGAFELGCSYVPLLVLMVVIVICACVCVCASVCVCVSLCVCPAPIFNKTSGLWTGLPRRGRRPPRRPTAPPHRAASPHRLAPPARILKGCPLWLLIRAANRFSDPVTAHRHKRH